MTIKLGNTTLCAGATRDQTGSPMGPDGVTVSEAPGVELREFVGADRVQGEHVKCDRGSLTFSVTRVYGSVSAAAAYALLGHRAEPKSGALVVTPDGGTATTVFANAVVTSKRVTQVGVAVVVEYSIEG